MYDKVESFGVETWKVVCERVEPEYATLRDDKGRVVHGYAVVSETPAHMLGCTLHSPHGVTLTVPSLPFKVALIATRDGARFGAIPRSTWHATREEALAHARKALAAQGKRYAKKFGV